MKRKSKKVIVGKLTGARAGATPGRRLLSSRPKTAASAKPNPRRSRLKSNSRGAAKTVPRTKTVAAKRKAQMPGKPVSADADCIRSVLDELSKAQAELTARGVDLLAVAHELGRKAVDSFKTDLVRSLIEDDLLPDLKRLHETLISATNVPAELRLVAEAVLNWLARHLELTEHLQTGQSLEVPATQLGRYDLKGPPPQPGKSLVQLRVLAPGWKHCGRPIIQPKVAVAPPTSAESTAASPTAQLPP